MTDKTDDFDAGLKKAQDAFKQATDEMKKEHIKLVAECPYETKLAVTAWVMEKIVEHAREGGSFRVLIYDRLGFGTDAYVPLYLAGGMEISNEFDLSKHEKDDDS
jgi:hypothetical protein